MSKANQEFKALADENYGVVQLLTVQNSHAKITTVSAASANAALPGDGVGYRVTALADVWLQWGTDNSVVADANDMLFSQGTEPLRLPSTATWIAARAVDNSAGVIVGITELLGEQ